MRYSVIFIAPLLVARIYSLFLSVDGIPSADALLIYFRGFLSDIAVGICLRLILQPLFRRKYLFYTLWVLWVMFIALNAEHIKVNASNLSYSFVHLALAKDFIYGSVFTVKNAAAFILLLALSVPLAIVSARIPILDRDIKVLGVVAFCLVLLTILAPTSKAYPYWLQMNFIEENAKNLASKPDYYLETYEADPAVRKRFYKHDLSGKQIIKYPTKQRNVLLVLVEGLGHNVVVSGKAPFLKKLSEENLYYSNFLSLQKQTNRGLYSVICGDYPNFLGEEAKADFVGMYGPEKPCLPEILRKSGYRTAFLQSADLRYMQKDMFASKAGFEIIMGGGDFKETSPGTGWGVDDSTLYKYVSGKIERLSGDNAPWFLTLLTSSTHHPYNVPGINSPTQEQALMYADGSLSEFIHALERDGALENTLVIITSDESIFSYGEGLLAELSSNHAPLIVISPEIDKHMIMEGIFDQADIMASVLDYLSISNSAVTGRSFFRDYPDSRNSLFGNTYSGKIYNHTEDGKLYVCTKALDCTAYENSTGLLFDPGYNEADADPVYIADLKNIIRDNELNSDKISSSQVFYETNKQYSGTRYLVGDHKLSASAGDTIKWSFKIQAIDDFRITFFAAIVDPLNTANRLYLFNSDAMVGGGKTVAFDHEFHVPFDTPSIWTKVTALANDEARYKVDEISIERIKDTERNMRMGSTFPDREEAMANHLPGTPERPTIFRKHRLIGHSFGEIGGHAYTNSREAFLINYNKGRRIFEVDLTLTSDGEVVCFHEGSEEQFGLKDRIGNTTLEEFKSTRILGRYTPMDLSDLIDIMREYDDVYIVTDTKGWLDVTYFALSAFVREANKTEPEIAKRIIPQVYDKLTYDMISSIYPFQEMIYTLYNTDSSDAEVLNFLKTTADITALTVSTERFNNSLAQSASKLGKAVFVHTVNEPKDMDYYKERGAYGFYTDSYLEQGT